MRRVAVILLASTLAVPAWAQSSAALPYTLTVAGTTSGGTLTGTLGGVQVRGTYANGAWTLTVQGQTFASGSYTCSTACTFTGVTVIGRTVSFTTSTVPLGTASTTVTLAGSFTSSQFPTHGAWVSAVAQWANTHLTGAAIGHVVSEAARIEGQQASSSSASPQGKAQGLNAHAGGSGPGSDSGHGARGR